jgi:tRNA modification GTPase
VLSVSDENDTIAAISSAVGNAAARVIVRMSGSEAPEIARQLLTEPQELPAPSTAQHRRLRFRRDISISAWIYRFASPRSATGEDVIEIHLPGSALLSRLVLDDLVALGARPADPGEFTARAFFNGRIGLSQAEGIAATIGAHTQAELDAARRLMSGELTRRLAPITDRITQTLALIEVGIDFTDEDVSFLPRNEILARVNDADAQLGRLLRDSHRFERLAHEPQVVLVGRPNAGKSTLLNVLAGHDRAVVSPVAGTTRDVISAQVPLRRGLIRIHDAAGLADENSSSDPIEQQMQAAARRAMESADVLVLLHDSQDPRPPLVPSREPDVTIATKIDLGSSSEDRCDLSISAVTGAGISELIDRLDRLAFGASTPSTTLALNARHVRAIHEARDALKRAAGAIESGAELIALELREALDALGSILGQVTPDDVLARVFSAFCIGK